MSRIALLAMIVAAVLTGCTSPPSPPSQTNSPAPTSPGSPVPGDVAVFLLDGSTTAQKQAIEARLNALPGVTAVRFETRAEAYQRFRKAFGDSPGPLASVRPEALPEAFRFRVSDRSRAEPILAELRRLPGVDQVSVAPEASSVPTPLPTPTPSPTS